jgi:hypothetical protein
MLAPYLHSKLAAKPQPPDPVFIEQALTLPRATTLAIALDNISRLSEMKAQGQLDFATADTFINDNRIIADRLIDEMVSMRPIDVATFAALTAHRRELIDPV